jgi:hypothetical protein
MIFPRHIIGVFECPRFRKDYKFIVSTSNKKCKSLMNSVIPRSGIEWPKGDSPIFVDTKIETPPPIRVIQGIIGNILKRNVEN